MPRRPRIVYPEAVYHVFDRGDLKKALFVEERAKADFERRLFEACEKWDWTLHAYVLLPGRFHLALQTPQGDLVAGMRWLLGVFSMGFNRSRGETGSVFRGRYGAQIVEPGPCLERLCDRIHLQPVAEGLSTLDALRTWRYSSYWRYWHPRNRPRFLSFAGLSVKGAPRGTLNRRAEACEERLRWLALEEGGCVSDLEAGWALGSDGFKCGLLGFGGEMTAHPSGRCEASIARMRVDWKSKLTIALRRLGKEGSDLEKGRKSEDWKVALALYLRLRTQADYVWIARALGMGTPSSVRALVCMAREAKRTKGTWGLFRGLARGACGPVCVEADSGGAATRDCAAQRTGRAGSSRAAMRRMM